MVGYINFSKSQHLKIRIALKTPMGSKPVFKRMIVFVFLLTVLLSAFVPSALAEEGDMSDMMYKSLHMAFGWVEDIEVALIGEESEEGKRATFWAKLLIWILIASCLYYAGLAMNLTPGMAGSVSCIIAVISVLGIPGSWIRNIIVEYGLIGALLITAAPLVGLMIFRSRLKSQYGNHTWLHVLMVFIDVLVLLMTLRAIDGFKELDGAARVVNWLTQFALLFTVMIVWVLVLDVRDALASAGGRYTRPEAPPWLPGTRRAQNLTEQAERGTADAVTLADVQRRLGELEQELEAVNAHLGRGGNLNIAQQNQLLNRLIQLTQENEQLRRQLGLA